LEEDLLIMSSELGLAPSFEKHAKESYMTQERLEEFVQHNKVLVTETNRKGRCVDGRYNGHADEVFPVISKPGATSGDVMAAFGAMNILGKSLPNQAVLDAVIEVEGGPDRFFFHTDEHAEAEEAGCGMGCGHMKKALLEAAEYGLSQDQMDYLFAQLPELLEQSAQQEILQGHHAESAVVIVESEHYGLKPMRYSGDEVQQVFVYQKTLHEQQLDQLARKLQEALAGQGEVVEEPQIRHALDQASALQTGATLARLAKGLPIYVVKLTPERTEITSL
jgi:hypothetical protein